MRHCTLGSISRITRSFLIATAQLLHGGTFALTQVALIKGIQMYVQDSKIAKFQGVYQGYYTAMIAIFTYLCGLFYDKFKADLFLYMSAIGIVSLLLSVGLNIKFLKHKQVAY